MTFVCSALATVNSSNTTAKLPSARCSKATVPLASASTRWNVPIATVVGPDDAGLDATFGAVDGGGDATGVVVAPLAQAARTAVDKMTTTERVARFIGGLLAFRNRACVAGMTIR